MPLGVVVGAFGTLIGAGGGFILVPVLLLLYPNKSPETITSISLAVVFLNSLSGSISYARMKLIDYKSGLLLASTTVPASILGAYTTAFLPRRLFDGIFALLLIIMAVYLFVNSKGNEGEEERKESHTFNRTMVDAEGVVYTYSFNPILGLITGAFIGYISSLLGIGGGIIHVPVLIHLLNFPVHLATATSHFMLAIMSLSGTLVHLQNGLLADGIDQIAAIGAGVVIGAPLGAKLSRRVKGNWIQRSLAVALALVSIRLMFQVF
jgi:uncharacterized membrane protein YfcA